MTDEAFTRKLANEAKEYLMLDGKMDDPMLLELGTKAEIQKYIKGLFRVETDDEPDRTLQAYAISKINWPLFWDAFGLDRFAERAKKLVKAYEIEAKRERDREETHHRIWGNK